MKKELKNQEQVLTMVSENNEDPVKKIEKESSQGELDKVTKALAARLIDRFNYFIP